MAGSKDIRSQTDIYFDRNFGDALDREICAQVETLSSDRGTTMAEVALAWVCAKEAICCPIIGAGSVSQLEDNIKALDFKLTADEIEALDALYRPRDVINDHVPDRMPRHLGGLQKDL